MTLSIKRVKQVICTLLKIFNRYYTYFFNFRKYELFLEIGKGKKNKAVSTFDKKEVLI